MILIRSCSGHDELEACVQLQIETWGYDESDVIPRKAFLVAQKIGGQVIGAFDTDLPGSGPNGSPESMVGFAVSFPGIKTDAAAANGKPQAYLHSHMLAVRERYRDRGVGAQLKLEQRREALSRGIGLMEWTFDPLEIKNAYFNMERLGAIVRRFVRNQYGMTTSPLHGGLPTDRCTAEWWVSSERVGKVVGGEAFEHGSVAERLRLSAEIGEIRRKDPGRARAIQAELADHLEAAFGAGLAVIGVEKTAEWTTYLLGPVPSDIRPREARS